MTEAPDDCGWDLMEELEKAPVVAKMFQPVIEPAEYIEPSFLDYMPDTV